MSTRRIIPEVDDVDTLCCFLRLPQVISMCLAFSLVASMGNERGAVGNWCLAIWCLCFTVTVFISMYECFYYDRILPFFWYKLPITYACYATLFCLLTSIMYPIFYVQYLPYGPSRDRAIAASAFSCIACVLYAIDVAYTWKHYKFKNIPCYVHTLPGLLKILESAVACHLRLHQQHLPVPAPAGPEVTVLSFLLYVSAMVLWPLYQFDEKLGGQPHWYTDTSCIDELTDYGCVWDQRLAVAILTAINLLMYVADLVYWTRQVL
ncbi:hypothetical protein E5288_WYG022594 [Bos mutus]|uniref:MARVEL domain-containing protein n=1 Tax=Bos mutus TaxID=72004 RepID=A0A6B0QY28_9CETA|nr:hypothetical protein [Bos mutus]